MKNEVKWNVETVIKKIILIKKIIVQTKEEWLKYV